MTNSESDSENECFESAEESLDEDEEAKKIGRKLKKTNSEITKPVTDSDNVNSAAEIEKSVSSNSMSYRKRPDNVKRSISNTTTKPLVKLPSTDTIFKTDRIVPDAFFHDITNNLSKNINKSLSTLQQKSSNVKDLILSTLPVSSLDDSKGFSYDDNTVYDFPNEGESPNVNQVIEHVGVEKIRKKEETSQEETTPTNSLLDGLSCSNKKKKPSHLGTDSQEESLEEASNFKGNTLVDDIKEEISNITVTEQQDDSDINAVDGEYHKEEKESLSEKDSLLASNFGHENKTFPDSNPTDILHSQEESNNIDINKMNSVTLVHQTDKKSEIILKSTESEKTETESDDTKNLGCEKSPEVAEINQSPVDEINLTSSEQIIQDSLCTSDNRVLPENDDSDLNFSVEVKREVDSQCNVEELKMALENIVKDKTNSSVNNNGISENQAVNKDFTHEEKTKEVPQSSNDGWDDFDFSDTEIEGAEANKTNFGGGDMKEKEEVVLDSKVAVSERKSVSDEVCAEPAAKVVSNTANDKDLITKEKVRSKCKDDSNVIKITDHVPETESVPDDTWDWNDSWDETSKDKNQKAEVAAAKPKSEKIQDDSSDISKWTGWDTFGQKSPEKQGNWSLGSWGVDMLLSKATVVTQGISSVLEAGLGAPDPETLAQMEKAEREKLKELETEEEEVQEHSGEISKKNSLTNVNLFPVSGITNLVAGVTSKIVEHSKIQEISSKVITGGLDTLETFGKKTMEVLQEGDPGLKNKRALLMGNNKPILSQVLREAREKADREMKKVEEKEMSKKCHFETLFDDFQGMVHLEALEMLSRQCELKLEQIRTGMNAEEQEDLNGILEEVEQLCALDECELDLKSSVLDFKTVLQMAVEPLKNEISVTRIIQIHENTNRWLEMSSETEPSLISVNQKLVSTLAELAAATVQQFHKSGELLSVKECRKTVEEVDALSRLTNALCTEINRLCEKFISLSQSERDASAENSNSMTEKVTVVMKNSTSYIRQAFDLLIPVIQLGAAV